MAQSDVGRTIAEIKARAGDGLTWDALARRLGASSGDYVRKVASGAKPGHNLRTAVDELMRAGRVQTPVQRRRTKTGELARVRASRATGAPSRVPDPVQLDPTRGTLSVGPAGALRWSGEYAVTETNAILRHVRGARDSRQRVSFRIHKVDANGKDYWVRVGAKGGYDPQRVLRAAGRSKIGVIDWIESQSERHYLEARGLTLTTAGIEVYTV